LGLTALIHSTTVKRGFESHSRRQTPGFLQRCYKRDIQTLQGQGESNLMPFQDPAKYRKQVRKSSCASLVSVSEEDLELERKIDAITKYQKPYHSEFFRQYFKHIPHHLPCSYWKIYNWNRNYLLLHYISRFPPCKILH
jgi:hypothetical protein